MRKPSKPLAIIILGPPGSGKGTQAELLTEKFNLYHFETSEIIEKNFALAKKGNFVKITGKKYYLSEEKKLRGAGKWMSPPLIAFWVKSKMREIARDGKGIAMSGSPKTLFEAKEEIPLLKKLYGAGNIKAISIKQSPEVSVWRNSKRRICQLMRHPILYSKETAKLTKCPVDGSRLIRREDSSPKVVRSKIKEYQERTLPIFQYFKRQGLKTKEVNGEQSVAEVHQSILKAIQ